MLARPRWGQKADAAAPFPTDFIVPLRRLSANAARFSPAFDRSDVAWRRLCFCLRQIKCGGHESQGSEEQRTGDVVSQRRSDLLSGNGRIQISGRSSDSFVAAKGYVTNSLMDADREMWLIPAQTFTSTSAPDGRRLDPSGSPRESKSKQIRLEAARV